MSSYWLLPIRGTPTQRRFLFPLGPVLVADCYLSIVLFPLFLPSPSLPPSLTHQCLRQPVYIFQLVLLGQLRDLLDLTTSPAIIGQSDSLQRGAANSSTADTTTTLPKRLAWHPYVGLQSVYVCLNVCICFGLTLILLPAELALHMRIAHIFITVKNNHPMVTSNGQGMAFALLY